MADRASGNDEPTTTTGDREPAAAPDEREPAVVSDDLRTESGDAGVDPAVKRRLREAYLNDEENALIVTRVRSAGDRVAVEMRPPHGDAVHTERFDAPRDGSLAESEAFLSFLRAAGVSPLDVDGLVGTRVPATYDADEGWRVDPAYHGAPESRLSWGLGRARDWLWTYRMWLVATLLIGGELVFALAIILVYG